MPVSSSHQAEINRLADKAVKAWEWNLGSDVNPTIIRRDDIVNAFEEVRAAIRDDLDTIAARAGRVGYSVNTLRGNYFPAIWKTLSSKGVFLDFDGEELVPATAKHLRGRLLKDDQDARQAYDSWHKQNESTRYEKRMAKQMTQIVWNLDIFDEMTDLATDWLLGNGKARNVKHQVARHVLAVCWFTGRRPWAEAALNIVFEPADGPDWADGWILATGMAKRTKSVVEGTEDAQKITIPLFGIETDEFIEGFNRLRQIQSQEPWFKPETDDGHLVVKDALNYYCREEIKNSIGDIFAPVTEGGYGLKFEMKTFRALYASQGHHRQQEWCLNNGQAPANINGYAKRYIGHFGQSSEQDTAEYLRWTFIGDREIPKLGL